MFVEKKTVMPSANDDLLRRRWIWQALSELFLDEEITEETLRYAARISAECFYSEKELKSIYCSEVAPAVAFNFFLVAGTWGYFDSVWLESRILKSHGLGYWFNRLTFAPIALWLLRREWRRLKEMAREERARVRDSRNRKLCWMEEATNLRWEGAE